MMRAQFSGPPPAPVWDVHRDHIAPVEQGYMYHAARRRLIAGIAAEGLTPQPDGIAARFTGVLTTWWGSDLAWVARFHIWATVLLRTHVSNGEFVRTNARAPEYVCHAGIAAADLEYLGADRRWHRLEVQGSGNGTGHAHDGVRVTQLG